MSHRSRIDFGPVRDSNPGVLSLRERGAAHWRRRAVAGDDAAPCPFSGTPVQQTHPSAWHSGGAQTAEAWRVQCAAPGAAILPGDSDRVLAAGETIPMYL